MMEKNSDDFFDEKTEENKGEEQLMGMLDSYDKPDTADLKKGDKCSGTVSRIGDEFIFVDINARSEALLKKSDQMDENNTLKVSEGDKIDVFVSSIEKGEVYVTTSLSGFSAPKDELYEAMKSKLPLSGKVTGVNTGGLQVKVLGHSAFCPLSQIELKFVDDVNVYLGKTMDFCISRIDNGGKNIVLSRMPLLEKELEAYFETFEQKIANKEVISGKITRIADFGLFVELDAGIEGLVHISEVSWIRSENLKKSFSEGQTIECVILKVEKKKPLKNSKISLSIKQAGEDPWTKVTSNIQPGEQVEGRITRLTPFGAFVELVAGVEGLIHISEMSWSKRIRHPKEVVKAGDKVKVTILNIDTTKRTIGCSLKDINDDPWKKVPETFPVGTKAKGKVASRTKYGFFIDLTEDITGLLPFANISSEHKGKIEVDEEVEVTIAGLDIEQRRISLSIGMVEEAEKDAFTENYLKEKSEKREDSSVSEFGAALKAAMKKKDND